MKPLKAVFIGLAAIALIGISLWQYGWSPLNLLFGPQYEASRHTGKDSRRKFVKETVPQKYPMLVKFLRAKGAETLSWNSQSGEPQVQVLKLTAQGLLIETAIFLGSSHSGAPTLSATTNVKMLDTNLDGQMDSIIYTLPSGEIHNYNSPFDETSKLLWDSALAITFKFSECCR